MTTLLMPEGLRGRLSKGLRAGRTVRGREDEALEVAREVAGLMERAGCVNVVAVGDMVCRTLTEASVPLSVCVIDGKVKRADAGLSVPLEAFDEVIRARNPRSHLTAEVLEAVAKALNSAAYRGRKVAVVIEGEEDLVALPTILYSPLGYCVVFGIPNEGIQLVRVSTESKLEVLEILKEFREVR